jgi:hypothetical protein
LLVFLSISAITAPILPLYFFLYWNYNYDIHITQLFFHKEEDIMKITLDLDTNEIIVPKNFFKNIDKQNDLIVKMGGSPIKATDLIKKSFEEAMSNTDKYLRVKE